MRRLRVRRQRLEACRDAMGASLSPTKTKLVLVADDDENDVLFLRRAFQRANLCHTIVHVKDGEGVVEYLTRLGTGTEPGLLLLDLKMPRMDGFDVLTWLRNRQERPRMPVVVFSSSELPTDKEKVKTLGADDYLVKPDNFDSWILVAKKLHEQWLDLQSPSDFTRA